ncbi:hypothetical protein ACW73L_21365 [Methylolobus aquaticus]
MNTVVKAMVMFVSFSASFGLSRSVIAGEQWGFSVRSIYGCYIEALSGNVLPDPNNPNIQLPIASLIRFCADGKGNAPSVSATHNIAGSCIIEQTGEATYSLDPNGLGTVRATVNNDEVSAGCIPPINLAKQANFELRFGIQRPRGCLQTIATSLTLNLGSGPAIPVGYVAQGEACPQR